jgi:hypothetical protein
VRSPSQNLTGNTERENTMPSINEPTLASLLAQIETAWEERGDAELVEQLADQHPEFAEDLFAFFDAILSEDDELPPGVGAAAVRDTMEWLKEEHAIARGGSAPAETAAAAESGPSPPQDLLGLLCGETGKSPTAVAAEMEDTPLGLIVMFARYPELVPPGPRRAFARRAHRVHQVSRDKVTRKFEETAEFARAASRTGAYSSGPTSYEELLNRAGLSPELRALWLRLQTEEGEADE